MFANTPDYRGYHACPCRDCFEIAIGGQIDDDGDEDPTLPGLCLECEEAGCDPDGESACCVNRCPKCECLADDCQCEEL